MTRRNVLFLAHRTPYPPNRGDRIRSWPLLRFVAERADVDLACLTEESVTPETHKTLAAICRKVAIEPVSPIGRWRRAAWSAALGGTATEGLFASPRLARRIGEWTREHAYDAVLVFCSSMAQYVSPELFRTAAVVVDLVDVDSQKWFDYAAKKRGLRKMLYALEGRRLRKLELRLIEESRAVTLVSSEEASILAPIAPPGKLHAVSNGVDLAYFDPSALPAGNGPASEQAACDLVFVGAMDYWPNVDAMTWFCEQVWPGVLAARPETRLAIVGRRPAEAVRRLAQSPGVSVVADPPDVRPYVAAAKIAIAPLRVARGIQNKVLEAMAMARPVIASVGASEGLDATPGAHLLCAASCDEWRESILKLLDDADARRRLGERARRYVEEHYVWRRRLARFADLLGLPADESPFPQTLAG